MSVRAPFAFARVPRRVWLPKWGRLVSHDVPFADGFSGVIELAIEAKTELMVGGPRRKATDGREGEVWPVRLPHGPYALPPSSLQGMVRNILEIACFGRLGPFVDDRRYGVRDISPTPTSRALYQGRMTEAIDSRGGRQRVRYKVRTGWLIKNGEGVDIIKCEHARIDFDEILQLARTGVERENLRNVLDATATGPGRNQQGGNSADQRYEAFLGGATKSALEVQVTLDPEGVRPHPHSRVDIDYMSCRAGAGVQATLVITGKPAPGWDRQNDAPNLPRGLGRKKMEFVFHTPSRSQACGGQHPRTAVRDDVLRDFRLIHEPPKGSGGRDNPNWQYWKREFEEGEPVPVFFLEDVDRTGAPIEGTVAAMGTAFMFKLAQTSSTRQMLAHSDPGHLDGGELDLASLSFGAVDESGQTKALKRRAAFGWAEATLPAGQSEPIGSTATVLSNPKPSYFPIYVRQPHRVGNRLNLSKETPPRPSEAYASYTPVVNDRQLERKVPELSGAKIWPAPMDGARPRRGSKVRLPAPPDNATRKVQAELNMLPVGTSFSNVTLHVHNLRKTEVGALLWALTFGHADALNGRQSPLRHRLGGGKPIGLGSIRISLGRLGGLRANSGAAVPSADDFVKEFLETMRLACLDLGETKPWIDSAQVKALMESAEPSSRPGYMNLEGGADTYVTARRDGYFMAPYADDGWEFPRNRPARPGSNGGTSGTPVSGPDAPRAAGEQPPAVKGAKVKVGPSVGEIIAVIGNKFRIRRASGSVDKLPRDSFVVIAAPKPQD